MRLTPSELATVEDPTAVTYLEVIDCGPVVPDALYAFTSVDRLTLRFTSFERFPDRLGELSALRLLRLELPTLRYADLGDFAGLTRLVNLDVQGQAGFLSFDCSRLTSLESLLLHGAFKALPDSVATLENLDYLLIESTALSSFPPEIIQLSSLRSLFIRAPLWSLPTAIGRLGRLEVLDIAQHRLETLPEELSQLQSLNTLRIQKGPLQSLPRSLVDLAHLKVLELTDSALTGLPEGFEALKLRELSLTRNLFTPTEYVRARRLPYEVHLPRRAGTTPSSG